jgi:hypothetical protein
LGWGTLRSPRIPLIKAGALAVPRIPLNPGV